MPRIECQKADKSRKLLWKHYVSKQMLNHISTKSPKVPLRPWAVLLPQPFSPILVFSLKLWDPSSSLFIWIDWWKLGAFDHIFAFEGDCPPSCLLRSVSSSRMVCSSTHRAWNFCLNEENWCFGRNWAFALLVFSLDRASFGRSWVLYHPPLRPEGGSWPPIHLSSDVRPAAPHPN